MYAGITALMMGYVLSQFFRAFLAVLTPVLIADLGLSAADLASASGWLFLTFAAMQLPIGSAAGPHRPRFGRQARWWRSEPSAPSMFSQATEGPSPEGRHGPDRHRVRAGADGQLFHLCPQLQPLGLWHSGGGHHRLWLAWQCRLVGSPCGGGRCLWLASDGSWPVGSDRRCGGGDPVLVRDPPRLDGTGKGSLLSLLQMPAIWPILAMMTVCYTPIAGLRGLWIGPYFADVHGATQGQIGRVGLWIGLAMVAGNFAYGPLDRWLGTRKWVVFIGNALTLVALALLWWFAAAPPAVATALLVAAGFFGASFPMVVAHGRAFFPPHLMGRGVTLLNLFGIAPIGLAQILTGRIHDATPAATAAAPYQAVFLFFAATLALGLAVYLLSQDRTD